MQNYTQKTINETIELQGVGLHNGVKVNLVVKPADPNTGIIFKRVDLDDNNIIKAKYDNVIEPVLCTKLKNSKGISVSTIEHLMAAFYGEGIDNAVVEIDAPEIPITDGSAFDFVEAINSVGTQEQDSLRKYIKVLKKFELKEKFPRILLLGGSSKINNNILSLYQIDYFSESKDFIYKLGIELDMLSMKNIPMDIRLGLNNKNDAFNTSLGFGYNLFMKNKLNLSIDYALDLGMVDEGLSHLFTLTFNKE